MTLVSECIVIILLSKDIFKVPSQVTLQEQFIASKIPSFRILILDADSWAPLYSSFFWLGDLGCHTYVSKLQFPQL